MACGDIEETIKKASPLITEVKLFDIYRGANLGEGKKSMAFSLTLSDPAAEVSNEQVVSLIVECQLKIYREVLITILKMSLVPL